MKRTRSSSAGRRKLRVEGVEWRVSGFPIEAGMTKEWRLRRGFRGK